MSRIHIVRKGAPPGWGGETLIVRDSRTMQHYVVETIQPPWRSQPETLVYPTDPLGNIESIPGFDTEQRGFVAGGLGMTQEDAVADLEARIVDSRTMTPQEALRIEREMYEDDYKEFLAYIQPSRS